MPNHKLLSAQLSKTLVNRCFYINFKNNCNFIFLLQIFVLNLHMFNN